MYCTVMFDITGGWGTQLILNIIKSPQPIINGDKNVDRFNVTAK